MFKKCYFTNSFINIKEKKTQNQPLNVTCLKAFLLNSSKYSFSSSSSSSFSKRTDIRWKSWKLIASLFSWLKYENKFLIKILSSTTKNGLIYNKSLKKSNQITIFAFSLWSNFILLVKIVFWNQCIHYHPIRREKTCYVVKFFLN